MALDENVPAGDVVDAVYEAILADLTHEEADLGTLARRYQQAQAADYFNSDVGRQVRARLLALGGREP